MLNADPRAKKALLLKLALATGGLLLVAAVFLLGGGRPQEVIDQGLALLDQGRTLIRSAGPTTFFIAMTLLPACGAPVTAFSLPAGTLFAEQLGMPTVVLLCLAAVTINMMLTYWLARRALRPWLTRLVARLGYKLPEVATADASDLILILRVTPGFPFLVQNYLLGLADVPLRPYVVISCIVVWSYQTAFVLFGDALIQGKGKNALLALGALIGLGALAHLVRKHYAKKQPPPAPAA